MAIITTACTRLFGIKHPVILAGMNVAAGPELAAAVTNAGGLGVIGGLGYTPKFLKQQIGIMKDSMTDRNAPFGIDLALPKVGDGARATNYDYTNGQLYDLINVIVDEKASLFVCAVGVPPKDVVEQLHRAKILVMNMVGHPKHVQKALDVGVDIICCQGAEGGGHTGSIPTSILIPACLDALRGKISPLTGEPVMLVAAGAIYDGRGLAAALAYGAEAVWVGTRFVAAEEAGAPKAHKDAVVSATYGDTVPTLIYSGRPLHVRRTPYVDNWENNRQAEILSLTKAGKIPFQVELDKDPSLMRTANPHLMGSVAALINDVLPAKTIVEDMVNEAAKRLVATNGFVSNAKL